METDITPTLNAAQAAYRAGSSEWIRSSADVATYFRGVLTPIYGARCFACSEPWTHNRDGQAIYLTFRDVDYQENTALAKYCTIAEIMSPKSRREDVAEHDAGRSA